MIRDASMRTSRAKCRFLCVSCTCVTLFFQILLSWRPMPALALTGVSRASVRGELLILACADSMLQIHCCS